jgi:hypothetical protein
MFSSVFCGVVCTGYLQCLLLASHAILSIGAVEDAQRVYSRMPHSTHSPVCSLTCQLTFRFFLVTAVFHIACLPVIIRISSSYIITYLQRAGGYDTAMGATAD